MIIVQSPLRISLFGGGSDLPMFLKRNEGAVLSFTIDKRVYVVGHPFTHRKGILLKYSKTEDVESPGQLQHPIARVVLERYGLNDMDIAIMSDVPAGTGLGSSSAFTVALLAFTRHARGIPTGSVDLACEACEIEIDVLKEPIGFQDQWASAIGGFNVIRFDGPSERGATAEEIAVNARVIEMLEKNLRLVPVGEPRSARDVLKRQGIELFEGSKSEQITRRMVSLVEQGRRALVTNIDDLGPLLHEAWALKRELSSGISTREIDEMYDRGLAAGATGGKLLGAGRGGYLAFYVPLGKDTEFVQHFPAELPFRISRRGAGVVHAS